MELKENDYILGYWFADDKNHDCWYMMIIKRDNEWIGQYTFRYNQENEGEFDPFSGKDKKSIYTLKIEGDSSEEKVLKIANDLFFMIKIKFNNFSDHFLVKGDLSKFLETGKTKEYLHFKEASEEKL